MNPVDPNGGFYDDINYDTQTGTSTYTSTGDPNTLHFYVDGNYQTSIAAKDFGGGTIADNKWVINGSTYQQSFFWDNFTDAALEDWGANMFKGGGKEADYPLFNNDGSVGKGGYIFGGTVAAVGAAYVGTVALGGTLLADIDVTSMYAYYRFSNVFSKVVNPIYKAAEWVAPGVGASQVEKLLDPRSAIPKSQLDPQSDNPTSIMKYLMKTLPKW